MKRIASLLAALGLACAHNTGPAPAPAPGTVERAEPTGGEVPATAGAAPPASTSAPEPVDDTTAHPERSAADAAARSRGAQPIVIAAVGDIMLGTTFPDESKGALLPPDDGAGLLAEVAPLLAAADVAFGNLEGPLLDEGPSEKCARSKPGRCYAFRVPTRYAAHLERAGFDVLSVANNHVGDFGDPGRASTRAALERHGIRWSGAPGEVARLEVRGTRVALVAFSTSGGANDVRDLEGARSIVEGLASEADVVVVSFHGGAEGAAHQHVPEGKEEFLGEDRGDLRAFARTVVDAGADLVLGHGPHVVRGMEVSRGRLVAYSLGNFATYGPFNLAGPNGLTLVLEVRLAADGAFLGGRIHPARQVKPGGPRLDAGGEVIGVVRRLSREDFGPAAVEVSDDGALAPPGSPAVTAR